VSQTFNRIEADRNLLFFGAPMLLDGFLHKTKAVLAEASELLTMSKSHFAI